MFRFDLPPLLDLSKPGGRQVTIGSKFNSASPSSSASASPPLPEGLGGSDSSSSASLFDRFSLANLDITEASGSQTSLGFADGPRFVIAKGTVHPEYQNLFFGRRLSDYGVENTVVIKFQRGVNPLEVLHEAEILGLFNGDPGIIQSFGVEKIDRNKKYQSALVLEYASGGNVADAVDKGSPITDRIRWLGQILAAVQRIHDKEVIHRDLKLENLYLDAENNILIGDFGLARLASNDTLFKGWIGGSITEMPPEICAEFLKAKQAASDNPYPARFAQFNPGEFGKPIDVWNIGLIIFDLFFYGDLFFNAGDQHHRMIDRVQDRLTNYSEKLTSWATQVRAKKITQSMPESALEALRTMMVSCFAQSPGSRPDITTLMSQFETAFLSK